MVLGEFEIDKCIEIIEGSKLYVGNDTGFMHISGLLGINTIGLFGDTSLEYAAYNKKIITISPDELVFDTLPNGKVLLKKLPGDLAQAPIDEEETFLRQNFSESDNRNFRDGDVESSRSYASGQPEQTDGEAKPETSLMYDAPQPPRVTINDNGEAVREVDASNKRTTLITDEVRVYKGGSWKDRSFWLDPAQRRYLPEYMAADFVGFRCAMSYLGSNPNTRKRPRG